MSRSVAGRPLYLPNIYILQPQIFDIFKLKNRLLNINVKASLQTFIQTILVENHFVVMNIPSYVNFYNVQDVDGTTIPKAEGSLDFADSLWGTYLDVDYRKSGPKMIAAA